MHIDYLKYDSDLDKILKNRDIKFLCNLANCGDSKYIPKFYGWCFYENKLKAVMEDSTYYPIKDFFEPNIRNNYKLNLKQKIKILLESAKGLAFLHKHGIIHSQFKSANISLDKKLVEPNDLEFNVILTDFELFRGDQSGNCQVSGKWKYHAPEQFSEKIFTNKSDIFQFGMFIFELFSERVAYTDKFTKNLNDGTLHKKTVEIGLRPDSKVECGNDCPPEIMELYKICWELDKEKRLNTKQLVDFLTEYYKKL